MKESEARTIHKRCLLMARAEASATCELPDLGEEIYNAWTQTMDAANPDDFDLTDFTIELACKYQVCQNQVSELFEIIRLIVVQYDDLIDSL